MNAEPIVFCDNLVKIYKIADLEVVALQGLDLEIPPGELLALVGPSGAGKSTLLNLLGGLDAPSAGRLVVGGSDLLKMDEPARVRYKRDTVGFVWQQPARNLLPYLTARENVELPLMLAGTGPGARKRRALELLDMVMLADRANFRPERLSGGQQQRVALAIALANHPPLLLGDELTGQVDTESANEIFTALRRINKELGTTIVIVTHDPKIAARVDRVIAIRDGRTSTEVRRIFDHHGKISEEEWVILDAAGRLQIPKPFVSELELRERVKVRLEPDHVSVWPEAGSTPADRPQADGVLWKPPSMKDFLRTAGDDPYGRALAVLKGRSGSGKTTLLNLIAGLDEPTGGAVYFGDQALARLSSTAQKMQLRRRKIGFVYQTFGLLPYLSAGENDEVPLRMVRAARAVRNARVGELLELVGLAERSRHRTYELSGGEQQRVAIARALANAPALLLADEPTGQLDTATGALIISLLRPIVDDTGVTVIIASHDPNVHAAADRIFELQDGRLIEAETYP